MTIYPSQSLIRQQGVILALLLSVASGAALVVTRDPRAPLVFAGGLCAIAVGYVLLHRPRTALYIAVFLHMMPKAVRIEGLFDAAVHSMTALALGSWLLHTMTQKRSVVWNTVCILTVLYIVWAAMTLMWAPDLIDGRKKIINYIIGFVLVFLITNEIRSLKALDGLMRVLRVVGWILVGGGVHTLLFTNYQFGERLTALGENQNGLGIILIVMMPGVIWAVLRSTGWLRRVNMALSVIYILFTIVLVALSGSRGSAISLCLVLLAFWFWRPMRPWGMVGVFLLLGSLAGAPFLLEGLTKRFQDGEGGSLGGREELWRASMLLIRDHPWTGVGIGNGPAELHWYIPEVSSDPYKITRLKYPSHNPVLEATTDTGVPGMLLYVGICANALWQLFRNKRHPGMREGALAAYFPLMLGVACGFFASWVKAGGLEASQLYFLMLALLIIPSQFPRTTE